MQAVVIVDACERFPAISSGCSRHRREGVTNPHGRTVSPKNVYRGGQFTPMTPERVRRALAVAQEERRSAGRPYLCHRRPCHA